MAKKNQTNEVVIDTNEAQVEKKFDLVALTEKLKTKSAVIRYLSSEGMKRGEIAKLLNIRYQHVRNVLIQPVKTQS